MVHLLLLATVDHVMLHWDIFSAAIFELDRGKKEKPSAVRSINVNTLVLLLASQTRRARGLFLDAPRCLHVWQSFTKKSITDEGQVFEWSLQLTSLWPEKISTLLLLLFCYHSFQLHRWTKSSGAFSGVILGHVLYLKWSCTAEVHETE